MTEERGREVHIGQIPLLLPIEFRWRKKRYLLSAGRKGLVLTKIDENQKWGYLTRAVVEGDSLCWKAMPKVGPTESPIISLPERLPVMQMPVTLQYEHTWYRLEQRRRLWPSD